MTGWVRQVNFCMVWALALGMMLGATVVSAKADETPGCAAMLRALQVVLPEGAMAEETNGQCTEAALRGLMVNDVAIASARVPDSLAPLLGDWLSDYLAPALAGGTLPGQELLSFAPGASDDGLAFTQYYLKGHAVVARDPLWSDTGAYVGVVAQGEMRRVGDRFVVPVDVSGSIYQPRFFEVSRSEDLYVKGLLNHFDAPLTLRVDGDVLVVKSLRRDPYTRAEETVVFTYRRVAPGTAQTGLRIAQVYEVSPLVTVGCIAHQLTRGAGSLFDGVAPEDLPAFEDFLARSVGLEAKGRQAGSGLWALPEGPEKAARKAAQAAAEAAQAALRDRPEVRRWAETLPDAVRAGCPLVMLDGR